MEFTVISKKGSWSMDVPIKRVALAGFSGRGIEKMMEHVGQLEKESIHAPDYTELPSVYPVSPTLLTTAPEITVHGTQTSGEVEFLILKHEGTYYIGLGSDHTDRALERVDIQRSKDVCAKPIATVLWEYTEIKGHMDRIRLVSFQRVNSRAIEYQAGKMDDILPPIAIMNRVSKEMELEDTLIFSGTIPLLWGYRYGEKFTCRLADDELGREIDLTYFIKAVE